MAVKIVTPVRGLNADDSPRIRTGTLYALPSLLDIHVKSSTGMWQAWTADPTITDARFRAAIAIPIDQLGMITVTLPCTDTEVYRQGGGSVLWQLWDPDLGFYYQGALPASLNAPPYALKDLLASYGWTAQPIITILPGTAAGAPGTVEITSAPGQAAFPIGIAPSQVHVYRNGVRIKRVSSGAVTADEYVLSGSQVILGTGLSGGQTITIDYWL